MYLYIIFANLFNSLCIGLMGKYFGRQCSIFLSLISILLSLLICLILFLEILINNNNIVIDIFNIFNISNIGLKISFLFDSLSISMLFIILSISTFVHIFSVSYMSHDPFIIRFYTYLGFFTFFMIILVTADNFLQLFIG